MKKFLSPKQSLTALLTAATLSFSFSDAKAIAPPCLTTHLTINSGEYNGSPVTPGSPDPLWTISNKTAPFLGGGAPPIGYNAIVVTNPSTVGWGINAGGGGQWLSDYQPHAIPGIATTTGSEITFRRTFSMCRQDAIQFDMDILVDNEVKDILVDGVSTGWSQPPLPPYVNHYGTGRDWMVSFSIPLGVGLHTLEIVVDDEYGSSQNPVGLNVFGSLTSPVGALENDYMGCKYSCSPCLTGTLTVNSGMYNSSPVAVGSSDPLWSISNKTPTFIGGGSPAIGAQAIVVNPVGTWGTTASGPSQWISDYQPHANPGISTTTGSELTFRRTFSLCSQDKITFDFDILNDNYVQDILVDGVSVGPTFNQGPFPPVVYNYATGADWYVNFSLPLGVGTHTLDIIVNDEYGATQNPVGLNIAGTLTSPLGVLENDYIGCPYRCNQSSGNGGGGQGKAGVTGASELYYMAAKEQNLLYQNEPNPAYNQTSIRYEIAKIDKGAFIAVYNVAGQRIMKFNIAEPGKGSVVVDANTLKSGYYIYSLVVDGATVDTKKLIVTK